MEAGYRCANPTCRTVLTLDIHHLDPVAEGGGGDAENLIALCPNCHTLHHQDVIPRAAIHHWKGMLVALNQALDRRSIDLLIWLDGLETDRHPPTFSTDALVGLAPVLSAGLAEACLSQASSGGAGFPPYSVYRVHLTRRGRALLQSWRDADSDAYREIVSRDATTDPSA
jgi:hypothetical protein